MTDILDAPTFSCDICGVPVALTSLVPFKGSHVCRHCYDQAHAVLDSMAPSPPKK